MRDAHVGDGPPATCGSIYNMSLTVHDVENAWTGRGFATLKFPKLLQATAREASLVAHRGPSSGQNANTRLDALSVVWAEAGGRALVVDLNAAQPVGARA